MEIKKLQVRHIGVKYTQHILVKILKKYYVLREVDIYYILFCDVNTKRYLLQLFGTMLIALYGYWTVLSHIVKEFSVYSSQTQK